MSVLLGQVVLTRLRGLAPDAQSSAMREAYRTEWNSWLDTPDHNTPFPRVRNRPGMAELDLVSFEQP